MDNEQNIIKNEVEFLKLAQALGTVSEACRVVDFSRDSFYRFKVLRDTGGEAAAIAFALEQPGYPGSRDAYCVGTLKRAGQNTIAPSWCGSVLSTISPSRCSRRNAR